MRSGRVQRLERNFLHSMRRLWELMLSLLCGFTTGTHGLRELSTEFTRELKASSRWFLRCVATAVLAAIALALAV